MLKFFSRPSLVLFAPLVCVLLFAFFITSSYFVERQQRRDYVSASQVTFLSQELMRMNHLVALAAKAQDFTRVEEELALLGSDIWLSVYTLIDHRGNIRFANHGVWRDSSAQLVIDGYDSKVHMARVAEGKPSLYFNDKRQSIQAYYPITPQLSSMSVERPELIYLEYDMAPMLAASDEVALASLARIGAIALATSLILFGLFYYFVLLPVRHLSRQAAALGQQASESRHKAIESPFVELHGLENNLRRFKDRFQEGAKQLKDSEQRWLFAVEVSRYGIWDWNLEDNSVFLSDRWKDMLGYGPEDLVHELATWEGRLHPEDKEAILNNLNAYLNGETEEFESVHRLRHQQGHYIWVLDRGMTVEWNEKGKPLRMIGTMSDVTEDIRNQKAAMHQAKHDPLTDLANRRALMDALYQQQEDSGSCAALFILDLDNFKVVNDALGHHGGDRLLIQIAARLSSCFSSNALIARLAADEFVVLVKKLPEDLLGAQRRAQALASQMRQLIGRSFHISDHTFNLSASVGITIIDPSEAILPEQQLKRVNMALAQAKESGRDACVVYSSDMDKRAAQNLMIRTELIHAVRRHQLSLFYQPLLNAKGEIASVEALLRWHHPQHGFISPADFIPVAEGSSLIIELGEWVLMEACRFIRELQEQGIRPPMVSINVSARQFHQDEFAPKLLATLQEQGISPAHIELELTEHVLLTDLQQVRQTMTQLREAGISIAVDDFGTGYSSLSYLQELPLNRLKLDASFIRDMGNGEASASIVKAMIDMSHSLNLEFVAEGVEIQSQFEQLKAYHCDLYQGYLFHRPMPGEELSALLVRLGEQQALSSV